MSRGPGRLQRAILDALAAGNPVGITYPDDTPAEKSAIRRAANVLESQGKILLRSQDVNGTARLVAYLPDDDRAPEEGCPVTGMDGHIYRRPHVRRAPRRDDLEDWPTPPRVNTS